MENRIELLRVFAVAAECRSFREAATRMGISPQVVTRAIKYLESASGEVLFHRNTRHIQLTDHGRRLSTRAQGLLAAVDEFFHEDIQSSEDRLETLRIAAPPAIGRSYLVPVVTAVLARAPNTVLDVRLSEEISDVVEERIDIGVRVGHVRDSRFVARPVANIPLMVCGSPSLVNRVGRPRSIDDLQKLPTTVLIDRNSGRPWPWVFNAETKFFPNTPAFVTDDPEAECNAVRAGVGFGQLPGYLAIQHVENGGLVEVLGNFAPRSWKLFLYRPRRQPVPMRVRLVFDALAEYLADPEYFPQYVRG